MDCAVNTGVQVSLLHADFDPFRYIHRSSIAGSYGSSIFRIFRNLRTNFHSDYTNLHSQQCIKVPFFPEYSPAFIFCFLDDSLIRVRWNLSVVLICISLMAKDIEHFPKLLLAIFTSFENCPVHLSVC
jgi:hypothetical protein